MGNPQSPKIRDIGPRRSPGDAARSFGPLASYALCLLRSCSAAHGLWARLATCSWPLGVRHRCSKMPNKSPNPRDSWGLHSQKFHACYSGITRGPRSADLFGSRLTLKTSEDYFTNTHLYDIVYDYSMILICVYIYCYVMNYRSVYHI